MKDISKMSLEELQQEYTLQSKEFESAESKIEVLTKAKEETEKANITLAQEKNVLKDQNSRLFLRVTSETEDKKPEEPEYSFDTINEQLRKEIR